MSEAYIDIPIRLKNQNKGLNDVRANVIKTYVGKNGRYSAIMSVDLASFNKLIKMQKINIGMDKCAVYEDVTILRCFKCCGYNHKSALCKRDLACMKCGGNHVSTNCKVKEHRCINCIRAAKEFNLNLDVKHNINDVNCAVYKKAVERKKNESKTQ